MSKKYKDGLFIVIDGVDGSGKSTQIKRLEEELKSKNYDVITTREPGGSIGAEQIRNLIVTGDPDRWDGISELLLISAARRNHVETVIKPALRSGKIVLCDRFVASTYAYQAFGRGVSPYTVGMVTNLTIGSFRPDLTFIFFIDPVTGLQRAAKRRGNETRFEESDLNFYKSCIHGYKYYSNNVCFGIDMEYVYVDDRTEESITSELMTKIFEHINNLTLISDN